MSRETAEARGRLAECRDQIKHLKLKLTGEANQIRRHLHVDLVGVDDLEVELAQAAFDDLQLHWTEFQALRIKEERLAKLVGG